MPDDEAPACYRYQPLRHSSQVLYGRGQHKLVARAAEASQAQPIELQDAFEMGK